MRLIKTALFVLVFGLATFAQDATQQQQPQLTQVPPKPGCNPDAIFHTQACEDLWAAYNAAFAQRQKEEVQLYLNKLKETATAQATAPLLLKISEQQEQIRRLQAELPMTRAAAHQDGMVEGSVYSGGGILVLFGLIFLARRLTGSFTVTKKSRAASA